MKFLAILRDSLREAIDAKVFYVMLGLSVLLIVLAASCTFTPTAGGEMLMHVASVPLSMDLTDLNLSQPEPEVLLREVARRATGGIYQVTKVTPVDEQPDAPTSTFQVIVQAHVTPLQVSNPEEHIRQRFGAFDKWRIAEVVKVTRIDKPVFAGIHNPLGAEFEVQARVTAAGLRMWPHSFSLFFGALPLFKEGVPLSGQLFVLENYVVNGVGYWVAILVSVVISAFFIPNMLRKGTIDLLLVKPISRIALLLYKYVGGLLFIFVNTTVAIAGVWLALGLRSGIWAPAFLFSIFTITFFFAILYSASTLFAVLTRSPIVSILLTMVVWVGLFTVGVTHTLCESLYKGECHDRLRQVGPTLAGMVGVAAAPLGPGPLATLSLLVTPSQSPHAFPHGPRSASVEFSGPGADPLTQPLSFDNGFTKTVAVLHFLLPRARDLDDLTKYWLMSDLLFSNQIGTQFLAPTAIVWGESLSVSGIFIALMLGLSCWRFATRDY